MTKKALDTNGLLRDNNTVKTHQSVRLLKKNLAFYTRSLVKINSFFSNKVDKDLKANKAR